MKYQELLMAAGDLPVIESRSLIACGAGAKALTVQLSRWVKSGKLLKLRRGVYVLPESLRRPEPSLEYVANMLVTPSYVSFESALSFHGLIPESVRRLQSVTTGRGVLVKTPLGEFEYRHAKQDWFLGYREYPSGTGSALVAEPEKALLDLIYFSSGEFSPARIEELRLQNVAALNTKRLARLAGREGSPAMLHGAKALLGYVRAEKRARKEL